jgi:flagellin
LTNLETEFSNLLSEIDRVQQVSTFNGIALLSGGSVSIQVGENNTANDRISITLTNTGTSSLGISSATVATQSGAQSALDSLDTAISSVTTGLAQLGASQANLEAAIAANDTRTTNLQTASSRIMDADYAEESSNLAKYMIMNQSNVAMLAQANASSQLVLKLLG